MNGTRCDAAVLDRFAPIDADPVPSSRTLTPSASVSVTSYKSVGWVPPLSGTNSTMTIVPEPMENVFALTLPDASDSQATEYLMNPLPSSDVVTVMDPAMSAGHQRGAVGERHPRAVPGDRAVRVRTGRHLLHVTGRDDQVLQQMTAQHDRVLEQGTRRCRVIDRRGEPDDRAHGGVVGADVGGLHEHLRVTRGRVRLQRHGVRDGDRGGDDTPQPGDQHLPAGHGEDGAGVRGERPGRGRDGRVAQYEAPQFGALNDRCHV